MIQAPQSKPVETKAPVRADASSKATKASKEQDSSLEARDFANELEASLSGEMNVAPVEVTAEQALELPSSLVNQSGNIDTVTPKIFDPALTKGVEGMIAPTTTQVEGEAAPVQLTDAEVLEIANAEPKVTGDIKKEIAQALLKTPQVTTGRAPAIEFAQKEIDPQLLNMEDFVEQKNLVAKKPLPNAYGMKTLPESQKQALENGLKSTQVINDVTAVDGSPVNSQQFILNMMTEQNTNSAPAVDGTQAASKVFDMSNIKSTNTSEIISQITDYVVQAKAAKEPTVNMRVNHDQLGMIDITVSKSGANHEMIAINIGTHSAEGKNFFQMNGKDLVSHMASMGHNVSEMKVETPNQMAKSDFDFGSQAGRNNQHGEKQFGSEQGQRRHEQDRRQDLWKLLNQEAA